MGHRLVTVPAMGSANSVEVLPARGIASPAGAHDPSKPLLRHEGLRQEGLRQKGLVQTVLVQKGLRQQGIQGQARFAPAGLPGGSLGVADPRRRDAAAVPESP
jgi:hypothetical protein